MTPPELPPPWRRWVAEAPHPGWAGGALRRLLVTGAAPRTPPPRMAAALARVFGSSPAIGRWALADPQVVHVLMAPDLDRARALQEYRNKFSRTEIGDPAANLRRIGRRELARIVAREALDLAPVTATAAEISNLAEAAVGAVLTVALDELEAKHGPCLDDEGRPNPVCILGMGKLAGRELNLSSDVDLVFLHASAGGGTTGGPGGALDPAGFYARVSARVAALLGSVTDDGWLFRVDLGLRPGGRTGAPSQALDNAVSYYATWGQTWERAVLAKARPVAGHVGLGERFLAEVEPFVYRRSLDFTTIENFRSLKERMEAAVPGATGGRVDLKRGPGGIREVEFFVQTLQLIHGGRSPEVRCTNTLEALGRLSKAGLVNPAVVRSLDEGYRFLRRLEHTVQAIEFRQTHRLPAEGPELRAVERRLGFRVPEEFSKVLDRVRGQIRKEYVTLFRGADLRDETRPAQTLLQLSATDPQAEERLCRAGFRDATRALAGLALLRNGGGRRPPSARARRCLERVGPTLLQTVTAGPDPDRALQHLGEFLAGAGARAGYLSLLAENPGTARLLVRLFGTSDFLSRYLIRHPELLDELVLDTVARPVKSTEDLSRALDEEVATTRDEEDFLDALRRFRNTEFLRVALHDLWGGLPPEAVGRQLTGVAEACLEVALDRARARTQTRYGVPESGGWGAAPFTVLGLGTLGGAEIDYYSDLDLVFLYSGTGNTGHQGCTHGEFFAGVAQRLISTLATRTREGIAFRADARLRPSGRAGPLVSSLDAFVTYHAEGSQVWERQALLRLRPVAGDEDLGRRTRSEVDRILFGGPPAEDPRPEILRMRRRVEREGGRDARNRIDLKTGPGGVMDVEFAVQAFQLLHGWRATALRCPSTHEALDALCRAGHLPETEGKVFREGYRFLRRVEARLRIQSDRPTNTLPAGRERRYDLARGLGFEREENLLDGVRRCMEAVHQAFETVMEGAGA